MTHPTQPPASSSGEWQRAMVRKALHEGNRLAMLPLLRSRFGPWAFSPVTGYVLELTTTGRRSGVSRSTALNYAIFDGHVYVMAPAAKRVDWLRNLQKNPQVHVRLPGRMITGTAALVTHPDEALQAAVQIGRNCGVSLFLDGVNPVMASRDELATQFAGCPVVRISAGSGPDAEPITAGPHDPGSWLWTLPHIVAPVGLLVGRRWLRRRIGRRR